MSPRNRSLRHRPLGQALLLAGFAALALAGCDRFSGNDEPPPPPADNRPAPKAATPTGADDPYAGVTPMAERVAVLGLLNKRNGLVRDVTLKPGESIRVGRAVIRLRACERTAQWESPQETGAFVQLLTLDHGSSQWRRVFSGWLFRDRPERNLIQHPIYDVFVRSCTMRWPGELDAAEIEAAAPADDAPPANRASNAPQAAAATAAPPEPVAAPAPAPATPAPAPVANGGALASPPDTAE